MHLSPGIMLSCCLFVRRNEEMKKRLALLIGLLLLAGIMFTGCDFFQTITIKVTNYNSWLIDVYYRSSGSTEWQSGVTLVGTDDTEYFDLPSAGTYDFKVQDWVSSGANYVYQVFEDEDCSEDYGTDYDYVISISSSGSVSFY